MKLTPKIAEALAHLRGDPNFAVVLEGMAIHQAEFNQQCIDGEGIVLQRAQGGSKALQYWIDAFRDAPAVLEKFKTQQPQGKVMT